MIVFNGFDLIMLVIGAIVLVVAGVIYCHVKIHDYFYYRNLKKENKYEGK